MTRMPSFPPTAFVEGRLRRDSRASAWFGALRWVAACAGMTAR